MNYVLRNDTIVARDEAVTDIDDRGYQFGDGVYEVVRLYGGAPFLMHRHTARLRQSARKLGMEIGFSDDELGGRLRELLEKERVETGVIYIQVTRGIYCRVQEFPPADVPVELTAYVRELDRPVDQIGNGVRTILAPDIRWLRCDIKSLNLIPNILARQNARASGCYEALQHRDGAITEGAFSNIFRVCGETLFTPPEGNLILSGITRSHVLSLCAAAGILVKERSFTIPELLSSSEVFITSTSNEVMPVLSVDSHSIGEGKPGEMTRRIQALHEASFPEAARTDGEFRGSDK